MVCVESGTVVVVLDGVVVDVVVVDDHPPASAMVMVGGAEVDVVRRGTVVRGTVVRGGLDVVVGAPGAVVELDVEPLGAVEDVVLDAGATVDEVLVEVVDEVLVEVLVEVVVEVDEVLVDEVLVDDVDEVEVVLLDDVVVVDDDTAFSSTAGSSADTLSVIVVGTFPRGPSISSNWAPSMFMNASSSCVDMDRSHGFKLPTVGPASPFVRAARIGHVVALDEVNSSMKFWPAVVHVHVDPVTLVRSSQHVTVLPPELAVELLISMIAIAANAGRNLIPVSVR